MIASVAVYMPFDLTAIPEKIGFVLVKKWLPSGICRPATAALTKVYRSGFGASSRVIN
jgi:hypothetical protein